MNFIRFILPFICILTINHCVAQRFNGALIAGVSGNQVDGDTQGGYHKPGLYFGASVDTDLGKLFALKVQLYYIGKGAKKVIGGIEEFKTTLHYIEIPAFICFKPIKKGQVDIGIAGSYLISSKLEKLYETEPENLYTLHNFDFSAIVNLIFHVSDRIGVNTGFNYSIVPIKDRPYWFNNSIYFGLVYQFK